MSIKEAESLRDSYEYWKNSYKRTQHMNDLVRAKYYLRQYMVCLNNENIPQKLIWAWEEKHAEVERIIENHQALSSDLKCNKKSTNKEKVYTLLKDCGNWMSVREIVDSVDRSTNCVRDSLASLMDYGLVEKNMTVKKDRLISVFRAKKNRISPLDSLSQYTYPPSSDE